MQALNLMNDVTFVEASRLLAQSVLRMDEPKRLSAAFLRVMQRRPTREESRILNQSLTAHLSKFRTNPNAANSLLKLGQSPLPENLDHAELAAWTMICSTLLNLDETVTKE